MPLLYSSPAAVEPPKFPSGNWRAQERVLWREDSYRDLGNREDYRAREFLEANNRHAKEVMAPLALC